MYSQEPSSRNLSSNLMYSANDSGFKHGLTDGVLSKNKEILNSSSDLFQKNHQHQSGGLMRYRSAPSSYFASLLEGNGGGNNSNNNSNGDSSESESMFSALMTCHEPASNNLKNHGGFGGCGAGKMEISEVESNPQNGNGFVSGENGMVQMGGYLAAVNAGGGAVVGSYSLPIDGSGMENQVRVRNCSNLVRQSSSPAGFFSGFDMMQEVGNLRGGANGDASPSTSGLNSVINFMSGPSSNSRFMPSIAENVTESARTDSPIGTGNGTRGYNSHFPGEPWADAPFTNLKRNRDGDMNLLSSFSGVENQGIEPRNRPSGLTHHLSLPKTAVEMAAVETYLRFQPDSVPCKIRAKRGCATHPRSIAERMRRTRISERMKKLQELFPNMDKHANTADMLDLAVDHIKNLQKQVKTLKETREKCTCSSKQQQASCPSA